MMKKTRIISAQFNKSIFDAEELKGGAPQVAFFGRSNVGKSSLINYVCNQRLAKVSRAPGRTRSLNEFTASVEDCNEEIREFRLIDLPGFGYAVMGKADKRMLSELISSYLESGQNIACIFHLLDCRREPVPEDLELSHALQAACANYFIVLTKIDKIPRAKRKPLVKKLCSALNIDVQNAIVSSVSERVGGDELAQAVFGSLQ